MRTALAVPRIFRDVGRADWSLAGERGMKNCRRAWHAEIELLGPCAGQREQHVAATLVVEHVVKERAKSSPGEFDSRVRHVLHNARQIKLCSECRSSSVQRLQ